MNFLNNFDEAYSFYVILAGGIGYAKQYATGLQSS